MPRPLPCSSPAATRPPAGSARTAGAVYRRPAASRLSAFATAEGKAGLRAAAGKLTACEIGSVREFTKRGYDYYRSAFKLWVKKRKRSEALEDLELNLIDYLDMKLENQEAVTHVEKAAAAVVFAVPGKEMRDFPRLKRALAGYRKMLPPVSRYPLVEVLVAGVVGSLLF